MSAATRAPCVFYLQRTWAPVAPSATVFSPFPPHVAPDSTCSTHAAVRVRWSPPAVSTLSCCASGVPQRPHADLFALHAATRAMHITTSLPPHLRTPILNLLPLLLSERASSHEQIYQVSLPLVDARRARVLVYSQFVPPLSPHLTYAVFAGSGEYGRAVAVLVQCRVHSKLECAATVEACVSLMHRAIGRAISLMVQVFRGASIARRTVAASRFCQLEHRHHGINRRIAPLLMTLVIRGPCMSLS